MNLKQELQKRGMKLIDLANAASVNKATVTRWADRRIPAERVAFVSEFTGIPREVLRPDIFGEVSQ